MKIYSLLILLLGLVFNGCTSPAVPEPKIVTVIETVTVYVPTKMKRPVVNCNFNGDGTTPIAKLLDCIILQKKVINEVTVE